MHKSAENVITIGIILLFVLYMACGCNGEQPVQQQTEKMRKAHEKAQAELKAELQKVEASLSYQKSQIEGQFKQDLATAKASAAQLRQSAPPPPNAAALTGDMILLRDRQVSAKRLALQKKAKETIDRERTRLEDELAAYDAQISQENQSQRLNIQLKLQLDITDDERKELQEELLSINQEESKLKAAKKDEMGNKIEAMSNKELAAVEAEVAAYKAQLDKDIKNQVGYNPSSGTSNSSELEQKSKKIESELVAKQKRLAGITHSIFGKKIKFVTETVFKLSVISAWEIGASYASPKKSVAGQHVAIFLVIKTDTSLGMSRRLNDF